MTQLALPIYGTTPSKLAQAWLDYHAAHPEVYRLFCRFAHAAIAAGRANYSARAIFERMRWETEVEGGTDFKLPNAHVAFYSRQFAEDYPEHEGFFRTTQSEADELFGDTTPDTCRAVDAFF